MTNVGRSWRWVLALVFLACGFFGFLSGVDVTERDLSDANPFTLLYYAMGLFILGGMDLGVPTGGPGWGRTFTWIAYFGAPLLTTSALVEWLQVLVANRKRWLKKINDHTVIIGVNDLSRSFMEKTIAHDESSQLVIVERESRTDIQQELEDRYGARCLSGDFTDEYFLNRLRINQVKRVLLASDNDFDNFETASKLLELRPELAPRIILHCNRLRYLREMEHSDVVRLTHTFNSYHLAAQHLVHTVMLDHFHSTEKLDTVILAGFGRFGQTVLEELQQIGKEEIEAIAIIDLDAHRRVLVAAEQVQMDTEIVKHVFQGEIGHPDVWQQLEAQVDLDVGVPLILMATGQDDENLRAGIWLRKRHPNAKVLVRSQRESHFAASVSQSSGITTFSLQNVFRESMPDEWFANEDQSM